MSKTWWTLYGGSMSEWTIVVIAFVVVGWTLAGCATVTKTVTGPDGYSYTESITAIGGASIEKATQSFGGMLEVTEPNGKHIKVVLDSDQASTNTSSNADVLLAIINKIP